MALGDALALLRGADPDLREPAAYYILDDPLPEAAVRGRTLILSRALLECECLAAVVAHELGHATSLDGRLTEALKRLELWGDSLAPCQIQSGGEARVEDSPGSLIWGLMRWSLRLSGGGFSQRLMEPLWAAHWRAREYAADTHAARLGQAEDLASHLIDQEQPFDSPSHGSFSTPSASSGGAQSRAPLGEPDRRVGRNERPRPSWESMVASAPDPGIFRKQRSRSAVRSAADEHSRRSPPLSNRGERRAERRAAERRQMQEAIEHCAPARAGSAGSTVRRHFHSYSLHNQLLIANQCPRLPGSPGFEPGSSSATASARGRGRSGSGHPAHPRRRSSPSGGEPVRDPDQSPAPTSASSPVFDRSQVEPLPDFPGGRLDLDPPSSRSSATVSLTSSSRSTEFGRSLGLTVEVEPVPGSACGYHEPSTAPDRDRRRSDRASPPTPSSAPSSTSSPTPSSASTDARRTPGSPTPRRRSSSSRSPTPSAPRSASITPAPRSPTWPPGARPTATAQSSATRR